MKHPKIHNKFSHDCIWKLLRYMAVFLTGFSLICSFTLFFSDFNDRIAIENDAIRNILISMRKKKSSKNEFFQLLNLAKLHCQFILPLLKWIFNYYDLKTFGLDTIPPGVLNFLGCMGSKSPVCSYVYPEEQCLLLLEDLIVTDIKKDIKKYQFLQMELPIFYELLKDLRDWNHLPEEFKGTLLHLKERATAPFKYHIPRTPSEEESTMMNSRYILIKFSLIYVTENFRFI